jgi:hypothetical protein
MSCLCFLLDRAFVAAPTAQHSLDALREEPLRERLSDEIVSAHLEAKMPFLEGRLTTDHGTGAGR